MKLCVWCGHSKAIPKLHIARAIECPSMCIFTGMALEAETNRRTTSMLGLIKLKKMLGDLLIPCLNMA